MDVPLLCDFSRGVSSSNDQLPSSSSLRRRPHSIRHHFGHFLRVIRWNPSKVEWDLTKGPLGKLLVLFDTQVWVLLEISWMKPLNPRYSNLRIRSSSDPGGCQKSKNDGSNGTGILAYIFLYKSTKWWVYYTCYGGMFKKKHHKRKYLWTVAYSNCIRQPGNLCVNICI